VVDINNLEDFKDEFKDNKAYKAVEAAAAKDPVLKRISKLTIVNRERISSTRNLRLPRYDFDTSKLVLFRLPKR